MNEMTVEFLDEIFAQAKELSEKDHHHAHVVELLEVYIKVRPDHARAWALYGEALKDLGRNKEGLQALTAAYELAPETYKAYVAMQIGVLLKDFQSPKDASPWFEIGCKYSDADSGWPWILRGSNLISLGEFETAIACFETALRGDHAIKDEAYFNLGLAYRALGTYEQAINCFKSALQITPDYEEAISALAGIVSLADTLKLSLELRKFYGEIH
ncbi:tetratricopeptide repeat protein [Undibacterium sp. Ji83W]|uniref:tetratricopeptide repeat protein n=1 Tax=Undibacterium sp. Ji83W TaxID=3413043 RepID=UPI003BF412FE